MFRAPSPSPFPRDVSNDASFLSPHLLPRTNLWYAIDFISIKIFIKTANGRAPFIGRREIQIGWVFPVWFSFLSSNVLLDKEIVPSEKIFRRQMKSIPEKNKQNNQFY